MTPKSNDRLEREVFIAAPPEIVFPYLVDSEKLLRWMGVEAALDPRPGGVYRCNVNGESIAVGTFLEVMPPERVVFSWGWEGSETLLPGQSTVEITLTATGSGTLLKLVHSGLPPAVSNQHDEGWAHFLERFATAATGADPGADPWVKSKGTA